MRYKIDGEITLKHRVERKVSDKGSRYYSLFLDVHLQDGTVITTEGGMQEINDLGDIYFIKVLDANGKPHMGRSVSNDLLEAGPWNSTAGSFSGGIGEEFSPDSSLKYKWQDSKELLVSLDTLRAECAVLHVIIDQDGKKYLFGVPK
jgi:hypothetical protein